MISRLAKRTSTSAGRVSREQRTVAAPAQHASTHRSQQHTQRHPCSYTHTRHADDRREMICVHGHTSARPASFSLQASYCDYRYSHTAHQRTRISRGRAKQGPLSLCMPPEPLYAFSARNAYRSTSARHAIPYTCMSGRTITTPAFLTIRLIAHNPRLLTAFKQLTRRQ